MSGYMQNYLVQIKNSLHKKLLHGESERFFQNEEVKGMIKLNIACTSMYITEEVWLIIIF